MHAVLHLSVSIDNADLIRKTAEEWQAKAWGDEPLAGGIATAIYEVLVGSTPGPPLSDIGIENIYEATVQVFDRGRFIDSYGI